LENGIAVENLPLFLLKFCSNFSPIIILTLYLRFLWKFPLSGNSVEAMVPSGVEKGWINGPIEQANAAHHTKMKL
jgi:hypothetical protein